MELYLQFVRAAESKDLDSLIRIIREHPELHDNEGDDGSLLDVIYHNCPGHIDAAFQAGLSPDCSSDDQHETFLQHAAAQDNVELVRLALSYGAVIERRNNEGETALGYAAAWASVEVVRILVEAGAEVNAVEGTQPDQYSAALDAAYKRPEIAEYLREHGAKKWTEL
jgi:ankyrin repeat protein